MHPYNFYIPFAYWQNMVSRMILLSRHKNYGTWFYYLYPVSYLYLQGVQVAPYPNSLNGYIRKILSSVILTSKLWSPSLQMKHHLIMVSICTSIVQIPTRHARVTALARSNTSSHTMNGHQSSNVEHTTTRAATVNFQSYWRGSDWLKEKVVCKWHSMSSDPHSVWRWLLCTEVK